MWLSLGNSNGAAEIGEEKGNFIFLLFLLFALLFAGGWERSETTLEFQEVAILL